MDDGKETVAEAEIARNVQHPNVVRMHALLKSRASLPGGPFSADVVLGSLSEAAVNGSLASLLE